MQTHPQNSGASLDELLRKLQDIGLALHSLNTDLKRSQQFKDAWIELRLHTLTHAKSGKSGPVLGTREAGKCLQLLERYFEIYKRYLACPLGAEFSDKALLKKSPQDPQSASAWWSGIFRKE